MKKQDFLFIVNKTIEEHPDWGVETMNVSANAVLQGFGKKIYDLETEKSNLAYGLVTFIQEDKNKKFPHYSKIQNAIKILYRFFKNAPVEKEIKELLK